MMETLVTMLVMFNVIAVRPAFGLEWSLDDCKLRAEVTQYFLDHTIGPDAQELVSDFGRQMSISEMPGKAYQIAAIFVRDLDHALGRGRDLDEPSVVQLQCISIGQRDGLRQVEEDLFSLIRRQANPAVMARIEIERNTGCRLCAEPKSSAVMDASAMHRRLST